MVGIIKSITTKKPFKRVLPEGYSVPTLFRSDYLQDDNGGDITCVSISQADFLKEYYPSGHKINSREYYPDIEHKNPEGGMVYEMVDRCAFAFQQVITCKQVMHLCGNSVQFEMADQKVTNQANMLYDEFRSGWMKKNMEVAWYEAVKAAKIVGDSAIVGYKNNNKFAWKVLSFTNGDRLYPHYDGMSGDLMLFARVFSDHDEESGDTVRYMEVWDDEFMYVFKRTDDGTDYILEVRGQKFAVNGYKLVDSAKHNFPSIPVAYFRYDDGACWSPSQDSIDKYELAFSRLSQNNASYAFPIMYFKGDNVEVHGSITRGTVSAISMGKEDEAGFLNRQDVSSSFDTQLDRLYKAIYEQSFAVIPPELKSGDLPGVALKMIYSPAYEKASMDANEWKPFIDKLVDIFKEGYGTEIGRQRDMVALQLNAWIKPYIHNNWTETISNMAMAVQNGFLSRKRANEVADEYATPQDWEEIMREQKEEQQHDLLLTNTVVQDGSTQSNKETN